MKSERLILVLLCAAVVIIGCGGNGKGNNPPIADAGSDAVLSINDLYSLDGSGSSDPDSDALGYIWSIVSAVQGDEPIFVDRDRVDPIFIPYEKGEFRLQLRVTDGKKWSEPDEVVLTAVADRYEPVAKIAFTPENPKYGDMLCVSGSGSIDPNNDPLGFGWEILLSPHTIDLNPVSRAFSFPAQSISGSQYRFRLTVDDSVFASAPAEAGVTIANTPPEADAGADVVLNGSAPPFNYNLIGSATDADGDALSYEWLIYRSPSGSVTNISNSSVIDPLFTANSEGFYVLRLRAFDGNAWSQPDYITLCKGAGCPDSEAVSISPVSINLHPVPDPNTGKYTAQFNPSSVLTILSPAVGSSGATRWITLWSPADADISVLDPSSPLNTTLMFEGNINLVHSEFILRLEADYGNYEAPSNFTFIKSSSDTSSDLIVNFVNDAPAVDVNNIVHTLDPSRVYQRIPISITAADPDGDLLDFHWSVVSKPANSEAFFSVDTNRADPVFYAGKGRDAVGEYVLRIIAEDLLGDSTVKQFSVKIQE